MNQARVLLASFPEVTQVVSQVGRPDDGTDIAGFFNTEYFVDLKPKEQWRPVFRQNKEALIAAMDAVLEKIPGALWNFSQPIADNMEEAVSGVKGQLAIKIYGDDLKTLEAKGDEIVNVMKNRAGDRGSGAVPRDRPAQPGIHGGPGSSGALRPQRGRRPGRHRNRGGRESRQPGSAGRAALRPGGALPDAVSQHEGSHREYPAAGAIRRAGFAGAIVHDEGAGRRVGDLSRGQLALCGHQIQRSGARFGQHGGGSHRQGGQASEAARGLSHRLGRANTKARSDRSSGCCWCCR